MSVQSLKSDFSNLIDILDPYWVLLDEADDILVLSAKTLVKANQEQVAWYCFYDQKRVELNFLVKRLNNKIDSIKGEIWKRLTTDNKLALNVKDKDQYVNDNPTYVQYRELLAEVEMIRDKFVTVCESFKARGFALRNLTDLYVNKLDGAII